jgi:hypothetical protein
MHLLPSRIGSLTSVLNDLWRELRLELSAFADFTEDLAAQ